MLLLTRSEMQAADRKAIDEIGIPSLQLMEVAGTGVASVAEEFANEEDGPVIIVCGKGNNGGDGLVAARILASRGISVQAWLAADPEELSGDAEINWHRLLEEGPDLPGDLEIFPMGPGFVDALSLAEAWGIGSVIVDGVYGTGISGAPREPGISLITAMNLSGSPVVAVDIPSGINADTGEVAGEAVLAEVTVTMAFPKLGMLLYPGRAHSGRIEVVDIGITPEAIPERELSMEVLDHQWALLRLPTRPPESHKGEYGRIVAVAGSADMMGAGKLVCSSAYRAGAGLVRHAAPESLLQIAHTGRSEVMVTPLPDGGAGRFVPDGVEVLQESYEWADVVAIGPGLGTEDDTAEFFAAALGCEDPGKPLVVDADGLNLLAASPELRKKWRGPVILTPHPGEAARLLKRDNDSIQMNRIGAVVDLANEYEAVAVLKGAPTIIADTNGRAAICPLGNSGMASGGTGDVLTGVIAGLLAQGLSPYSAACLGVYLHSLAADLAALDLGEWSMLAGDIVDYLPVAFGHVEAFPEHDVMADGVWT